jgi:hypothetical protein
MSLDDGEGVRKTRLDECSWGGEWDARETMDGPHAIQVMAQTQNGQRANDRIIVCVSQQGSYNLPARHAIDYENVTGEWPEKHILGTPLGPNENGRHWRSRRQRAAVAQ